ncbi:MAG TPA: glycosyltransferase family 39 protein [Anaerolineaceae bacterium]|nr:glycosyltransferase family 39 protein [Anaerolineaceae bacterium]
MFLDALLKRSKKPLSASRLTGRVELLAAAAVVLAFVAHAVYLNVPAEDAFITFRFAKNLAAGHGIVWNVGEAPVEGYTNFLWLLISAAVLKLDLDVARVTQALGVLFSLAALGVTFQFARQVFELPRRFALLAAAMLAVSGPFATWAASSMETNLFALLVLAGCFLFARWVRRGAWRDLIGAQLALLLATLTRPEGFLVFGVLAALGLLLAPGQPGNRPVWRFLGALAVFAVPFALYFAWRYQYFGYLLPNTFYAKTGGGWFQVTRGAKYAILFGLLFGLPLAPVAALYLWEQGGWLPVRRLLDGRAWLHGLRAAAGPVVCAAVTAAYTAYVAYVGGDYMAMFRFFVPVLPLIYLLFAHFAHRLLALVALNPHKLRLGQGLLVAAAAFTLLQSTPLEQSLFSQPWFMHGTWRGVQHERWHVARNTLAGEFFRDLKRSDDESVAVLGIGIISFVTDMPIRSFHGLVDPHIAHMEINPTASSGVAGHEKIDFVSVIRRKPTYIMVDTGDLYPEPQPFPEYPPEINDFVRQNYELKTAWLVDRVNQEAGYLHYLVLKEAQDD